MAVSGVSVGEMHEDLPLTMRNAYRSYFSFAAGPDSVELALEQFGTWLRERKNIDVDLRESLSGEFGNRVLTVVHNEKRDGRQVRCTLVEERPHECWRSELTIFAPSRAGRGWANLAVASNIGKPAEPPLVFDRIVDVLDDPRDGALPLRSEAPVIPRPHVDEVIEWITDVNRHALLFVAGSGVELDFGAWVAKVREWTRSMRGMAQTVVLDPAATTEIAAQLGRSHLLEPWTIRTYQPAALLGQVADGPRHRVLGARRLGSESDFAIKRLLTGVARRHANDRRTPLALARATRDLDRVTTALMLNRIFEADGDSVSNPPVHPIELTGSVVPPPAAAVVEGRTASGGVLQDESPTGERADVALMRQLIADQASRIAVVNRLLGVAWTAETLEQLASIQKAHTALLASYERDRTVLQRSRDELTRSLTQADDLRAEVETLRGELRAEEEERTLAELLRVQAEDETRWLRGELRDLHRFDLATMPMPGSSETEVPLSFDDLVDRLPELEANGVMFTGDHEVARSLADLDGSGKFALTAWESLLTLCSYVEARRNGDFDGNVWQFLDGTPTGYRRHPPGKHAAGESGVTMDKFGHLRVFPVPSEVHSSCRATMAAHFRLGKAGMQSPRMHYLDDFAATGRVYVGYLGPHLKTVSTN